MDHYQKKQQNYAKWEESIWLSVEKEITAFQVKVTDCMLGLGDLQKKTVQDYEVKPDEEVLGEQFYLDLIRPQCVKKGYLDKNIPTEKELEDSDESQDEDSGSEMEQKIEKSEKTQIKEVKKKKEGGNKKGKNNKKEQNKLKVIRDNFLKDIDTIFNTFTLENLNVTFGFSQKKLQVKLITFFYIALYIRKNKASKKIGETQIFQLVNIMIKIVKIFKNYKGKNVSNESQAIPVSSTLMLDMQLCIKGLKNHYQYTNKKIIINYPKLIYYTSYDQFFPTLDIKPYASQIQYIQSMRKAFNAKANIEKPTLIFYKTMIGSGKTSASLALSQIIKDTKLIDKKNTDYQVVYSCLIGSVRIQVGRYAYNKKQKFALAAMQKSIKDEHYYYPRVINSYSCRNQKIVDLIISDLDCTYEMLHHHHDTEEEKAIFDYENKKRKTAVNVGKLEKQNVVLFIDEPTAFCKDISSPATQRLFDILANYPPKIIILASATMPDQQDLPNTIKLIEKRNPGLQVFQIQSKQFQIGCQYCSFKGEVVFPHTNVKNKKQLEHILNVLEKNSFLLRLYTGPSLFFLLKKCEKYELKGLPRINDLDQVKQNDITKATFRILKILKNQKDQVIEDICKLSADQTNLEYKQIDKNSDSDDLYSQEEMVQQIQEEKQKKQKPDYVDFAAMIKKDAHKFLGGCLLATANPLDFAHKYFKKWVRKIKPIKRLVEKYEKDVDIMNRQIKALEDNSELRQDKRSKEISKLQFQKAPKLDFPQKKKINTIDHYEKYCVSKQDLHKSMLIKPVPLESVGEELLDQVDDFVLKLLFCGVALYMEKGLPPKYLDKVQELASQNYLAYIITDQSLCYGTNFPISNVILCDDLVLKLNMNEMFQLVGRAGRVGQSWTARAFLQQQGLKKLNHYIHSTDQKTSDEAEIFEKLAVRHLNNPLLPLRTDKSQIKYENLEKPGEQIQIVIKKKGKSIQDYHVMKKVVVIPFCDGKVMVQKLPHKSFNSYKFASSDILYEDIPTILNDDKEDIIDVAPYYAEEQKFIRKVLNNTYKRILDTDFENKVQGEQINEFKGKVYVQFFSQETNTFVIMVKVKESLSYENYKFQTLIPNEFDNPGDIIMGKLNQLISESKRIIPIVRKSPESVLAVDVKIIKENHDNFTQLPKTQFYRQVYKYHEKEAIEEYNNLIQNIEDKDSIECKSESVIALIMQNHADLVHIADKLFHVDELVRPIWTNLVKKVSE